MTEEIWELELNEKLKEHKEKSAAKTAEMQRQGVARRKLVEIVIKDGAKYCTDSGPAGASDPYGYYGLPSEHMTSAPGDKVVGYVLEINERGLTLSQGLLKTRYSSGPDSIYVSGAAVNSFRVINAE